MKNAEKKAEDNLAERKRQLEPYGRMNGEQLLEAYCDSAELQNQFGDFQQFLTFIIHNYDSPVKQYEVLRSLREIHDLEIKMMIRQRREAREAKETSLAEVTISKLIQQSESHTLEFKEIPECNTQQNRKNNDVLFPPLKTIAGFLNAEGGILLIGVDNSGKIVGIEPYLNTMEQGSNDTFEQQIRNCLRDRFEPYPIGKVKVSFEKFMEGTVCRIDVQADKEPVNLDNEVYVRDGNTTQLLKGRRLTDWIQQRRLLTVLPSGK